MSEINDKEFVITVKGPYTFSIGDTTGFSGERKWRGERGVYSK